MPIGRGGTEQEGHTLAAREEVLLADAAVEAEELRELVAEGLDRGYLTHDELAVRLADFELTEEQMREIHGHLMDHGVELISAPQLEVVEPLPADDAQGRRCGRRRRRRRRSGPSWT